SGRKGEERAGGVPLMTRTPGRLPRRLHQSVNKVKRAVGVGEYNPVSGQVMPAGGASGVSRTPRSGGFGGATRGDEGFESSNSAATPQTSTASRARS
ncbi:unnamed protein product, partial [Scytosiphon promiscuus]